MVLRNRIFSSGRSVLLALYPFGESARFSSGTEDRLLGITREGEAAIMQTRSIIRNLTVVWMAVILLGEAILWIVLHV